MPKKTTPKSPMPQVILLSQPRMRQHQTLHAMKADRSLFLLTYLASQPYWVSRETCCELLWPEAEPGRALHNLRQLLQRIRVMGLNPSLDVERSRLRWRGGSDLHQFREALQHENWERMVQLYQGPLIQGCHPGLLDAFAEWLEQERRQLHNQWIQATLHHAVDLQSQGKAHLALQALQNVLEQDILAEDILKMYLRLAQHTHQRTQALQHYQHFATTLQNELGLTPQSETRQLLEDLQATPNPVESGWKPVRQGTLVGRNRELALLLNHLQHRSSQVVTVFGPGGMGKTRLVLEALQHHPGDFLFVPLAEVQPNQGVVQAISRALDPANDENTTVAQLIQRVQQPTVWVLDNAEHLLEDIRMLLEALQGAPHIQLLVTSRIKVGLPEEEVLELQGLEHPPLGNPDRAIQDYPAVQLLLTTARRSMSQCTHDDLQSLAWVTQKVTGVPLALQLAASWLRLMPLSDMVHELSQSLDVLHEGFPGLPPRQRGLRGVFETSWKLLSPQEQHMLVRLSVFRGGFDRPAVLHVTQGTGQQLLSLLNSSLVHPTPSDPYRFDLHPLIQEFLQEKFQLLSGNEQQQVHERLAEYFLKFVRQHHPEHNPDTFQSFAPVNVNLENLRTVLRWSTTHQPNLALQFNTLFTLFWSSQGRYHEGLEWMNEALTHLPRKQDPQIRLLALKAAGNLSLGALHHTQALEFYQQGLTLAQELQREDLAYMLSGNIGTVFIDLKRYSEARPLLQSSLLQARKHQDNRSELLLTLNLSGVLVLEGEYEGAYPLLQRCLELATDMNNNYWLSEVHWGLGIVHRKRQQNEAALAHLKLSLQLKEKIGALGGTAWVSMALGVVEDSNQRPELAMEWHLKAYEIGRKLPRTHESGLALRGMAGIVAPHHPELAVRLWATAEQQLERMTEDETARVGSHLEDRLHGLSGRLGELDFQRLWGTPLADDELSGLVSQLLQLARAVGS